MNNELRHHGIKGMKWGVRRFQNKNGTLTPAGKKRYNDAPAHDDYKRAHSNKSVREMSDKELREVNNRLNMEKQYRELTSSQQKAGSKFVKRFGDRAVDAWIITPIIVAGSKYASKYMSKGIKAAVKSVKKR